jgi:glycosyltransferase involved in cell wall biosynthesis
MKVAFLSFDFGEYCVRLASALAREAEVLLLLPQQEAAPYEPLLSPGVTFCPFHKPRLRQPLRQARTVWTILRRIRAFDPDVIHLQQGHLWFNLVLPLLARRPLVLTIHDPRCHLGDRGGRRTPQRVMDFGFRRAAQVIVHGEELRRVVVEELGIPPGAVHDIPHVAIGEVAARPPAAEEAHTVLFFGRIWEYKGLDYLIRAEPLITRQAPDAKIVIAGRGEAFDRYRRLMVHPERFVVHNEHISDEMRAELFQRASVVALPYVEATQSGVIPVAYTFAKPVVATEVGGLPSMVEHGRTGYLVPPRDERALAEAILRLLRDPELRREMGANARRKLDAECGAEVVARQTLAVYRRALNREVAREFHARAV